MDKQNLYISPNVANRVKEYAKSRDISLKNILEDLQLGSNTFSHMKHGRMIAADSLARIADYLDCSVDYLLGRTDEPLSHKTGSIKKNLAVRLREGMRIRSEQLKRIDPKRDYGAMYWEEKSGGKINAGDIAKLLDAGTSNHDIIISLAELFNISVDQLTGEEEITAKNIHPYMLKPLGTVENGMRFVNTAANSDEGIYDENIDTDDEEFTAMANEPRGEDVE